MIDTSGRVPAFGDPVTVVSADVPRARSITLKPLSSSIRSLSEEQQMELVRARASLRGRA